MQHAAQSHTPGWQNAFQNLPREHAFEPLHVEGKIPQDLHGTLYRNGPALFERFGQRYGHWFDGDGAVSAVRFQQGQAAGAVRLVRSQAFEAEEKAGKLLFAGFGQKMPGAFWKALRPRYKNAANTAVLYWQKRLFALYEGGLPTELSPQDLHTLGESNLEQVVLQTFSAHPHYVPARHCYYNFGIRYGRQASLDIYTLPDQGAAQQLTSLPLSAAPMLHDFIATDRHLIFFISPLKLRVLPFLLGWGTMADNLVWRPESGTEVIVVPIDAPDKPIRFHTDAFHQWHFCNAFETKQEIVVDFVRYPRYENLNMENAAAGLPGQFCRARIDPKHKKIQQDIVWGGHCEFPQIAPEHLARDYPQAYAVETQNAAVDFSEHLIRLSPHSGQVARFPLDAGHYPSEPIWAPGADTHGYLLSLVYDAKQHGSYVAVFNAQDIQAGPLARIHFDQHIPPTFHGIWVAAPP